jgi:membrane protein implicated in regulation of membrane protease activity
MSWIVWLILAAVLVFVEIMTFTFVFLLLAGAALAAMVLALASTSVWVQLFGFVAVAFVLYAAVLPWLRGKLKANRETVELPSQRYVGKTGTVVQAIGPEEEGQVRVNGELWTAVSGERLQPGDIVIVTEVRVSKLAVKRGDET